MTSPQQPVLFRFESPAADRPKKIVRLCRTEHMAAAVQVLKSGGENNLHSHTYQDGFWFVLGGRVRFYTTGDEVLGEFGPHEGILIPMGFPYWFESVGDDTLELLQLESFAKTFKDEAEIIADRVNHQALRPAINPALVEIIEASAPAGGASGAFSAEVATGSA